jgi:hypothetical protein
MAVPNLDRQDFDSLQFEIVGVIRTQLASVGDVPARIREGSRS